jgi:hypothetical protein
MINLIVDCQTQETVEVPLTKEEKELREKDYQELLKRQEAEAQAKAEAAAKRQAAEAKLAALGLTSDDLKALGLGGN